MRRLYVVGVYKEDDGATNIIVHMPSGLLYNYYDVQCTENGFITDGCSWAGSFGNYNTAEKMLLKHRPLSKRITLNKKDMFL